MKKQTKYIVKCDGLYWYVTKLKKWFYTDDIPKKYNFSSNAYFSTKKQMIKSLKQLDSICNGDIYVTKVTSTKSIDKIINFVF